jgi:hypothetical protein
MPIISQRRIQQKAAPGKATRPDIPARFRHFSRKVALSKAPSFWRFLHMPSGFGDASPISGTFAEQDGTGYHEASIRDNT